MSQPHYTPLHPVDWPDGYWQKSIQDLLSLGGATETRDRVLQNKAFHALENNAPLHLMTCFEAGLNPHFVLTDLNENADHRWVPAFMTLFEKTTTSERDEMLGLFLKAGLEWEKLGEMYLCPLGHALMHNNLVLAESFLGHNIPLQGLAGVWQPPVCYVYTPEAMDLLLKYHLPIEKDYGVAGWLWNWALVSSPNTPAILGYLASQHISMDLSDPSPTPSPNALTVLETLMLDEDWQGFDDDFSKCATLIFHGANYSHIPGSFFDQSDLLFQARAFREKQELSVSTSEALKPEENPIKRL